MQKKTINQVIQNQCMNQITLKNIRGFDTWQNPRLQDLEKKIQSLAVQNRKLEAANLLG